MHGNFQARRISKQRADQVKKSIAPERGMLLHTFNGIIVIEPADAPVGDGDILSLEEADYELQPVWHLGPKTLLRQARLRLGLEAEPAVGELATVGAS